MSDTNRDSIIINDKDEQKLLKMTTEYVGPAYKSIFHAAYQTYMSRFPNNIDEEVKLFKDPTGAIDVIKKGGNERIKRVTFVVQPNVWIGAINQDFFSNENEVLYKEELDLGEKLNAPLMYFVVLRRFGDPSIDHLIKIKSDNVFLITKDLAIQYYEDIADILGYSSLNANEMTPKYMESINYKNIKILNK
jgi:hypothetical protein